jgi:hypothetical protein
MWDASTHHRSKLAVTKLLFSVSFAILAVSGQPRFEVASVKPGPPDGIGSMNGGRCPSARSTKLITIPAGSLGPTFGSDV